MAANNDNYIGIAMGLDVTDLKSGLSDANKQIQLANSEFKSASSGMENWQKSTEGLSAKVKQLDTVLTLQKKKLSGLQAEYDKVVQSQGENSEAARKLKVQINNQKAVVNATERELNNYSETLKEAESGNIDLEEAVLKNGKALKKQGDEAKESGKGLSGLKSIAGGVGKGLLAVGAAAIGAIGGFLSLAERTREVRENFARLDTAFESSGHSAKDAENTYTELYGVLGDTGRATEAAQQLAKMSKDEADLAANTKILTGVMAEYGDSIPTEGLAEGMAATAAMGNVQGVLADALEWQGVNLDDYNAKLATMGTEEERAAYIQKTLTDLYGESAEAFQERNKDIIEAREAEAALSRATAELGAIAEPIMTTLKLLAVDLLDTIKPFVQLIGDGLKGALEGTAGATDKLAEGLGGILQALVEKLMNMLPTILNVILQLVPTIATTLLDALPQLLDVVITLATQIINLLAELAPQIIAKIVEIIPVLISTLVEAVPQLLQAAITLLMAIVEALPTIIESLIGALPQLIDTIINAVIEAFPLLVDAAIDLFMAIIDAIPVIIQALVVNLPKIINSIIDGLLKSLPMVLQAAITLLMALIEAIPTIITLLVKELPKITRSITETLLTRLPDIIEAAIELFMGILEAIPEIVTELIKNMPEIISAIVEGLASGADALADAGLDLLKGIWKGIKDGAGWLKDKIFGFAGNVADWFKEKFEINSPSKVMADDVGEYIGEGIGVGVVDSIPKVKKQLGKFAGFVQDNLSGIKSGLDINASGSGTGFDTGRGNTVVNAGMTVNYNGRLSRKTLRKMENEQYSAIKRRLIAEGAI